MRSDLAAEVSYSTVEGRQRVVVVVVEGCSAEDGGGWGGGIVRGEGEGWRKEAPTHISRYVIMLIVNFVHPFLAIGIFVDLTLHLVLSFLWM